MLELRQNLQKRYNNLFQLPPATSTIEKEANVFLTKVRTVLEDNLEDENFSIHHLCRALGFSRAQLHRKLKALTNLSTSHFIRQVKIQKAQILLQDETLSISEVAYQVGFKDPNYFSRIFHEVLGQTPSDIRKKTRS